MKFTDQPSKLGADCTIDPTARFGPNVELGSGVVIEPYVVIHDQVKIGDRCHIASHVVLGIESNGYRESPVSSVLTLSCIGPESSIGPGCIIEKDVLIGSHAFIGGPTTIRQGSRIGNHFRSGSHTDIRGLCQIGDYVTCHSHVHVCQGAEISSYCWLMPYVVLLNDRYPPTLLEEEKVRLGEYSVIGSHAVIFPGAELRRHVIVGAGCHVKGKIDEFMVVAGPDSKVLGDSRFIPCKVGSEFIRPYPWPRRVNEGFPWEDGKSPL